MHQTSSSYFAYREPYIRLNLEQLDAFARSVFFWGYRPRAGDVIVDVGAGVGEEALTFSRAVGKRGREISIEAHPETFRCLRKLVQYNRLGNVTSIQRAVSEPSCELATSEDGKHYLRNRLGGGRGIPVMATTLDAMHQKLGLGRIHFLKMNIEGAERFAIRGMRETLRRTETLCVCCHDSWRKRVGMTACARRNSLGSFCGSVGSALCGGRSRTWHRMSATRYGDTTSN